VQLHVLAVLGVVGGSADVASVGRCVALKKENPGRRPLIGERCEHDGRQGVVGATYMGSRGWYVVGHYLVGAEDTQLFVSPWSDCSTERLAA